MNKHQVLPRKQDEIAFADYIKPKLTNRTSTTQFIHHVAKYYNMSRQMADSLYAYVEQYTQCEATDNHRQLIAECIPSNFSEWEYIMEYDNPLLFGNDCYNSKEW